MQHSLVLRARPLLVLQRSDEQGCQVSNDSSSVLCTAYLHGLYCMDSCKSAILDGKQLVFQSHSWVEGLSSQHLLRHYGGI